MPTTHQLEARAAYRDMARTADLRALDMGNERSRAMHEAEYRTTPRVKRLDHARTLYSDAANAYRVAADHAAPPAGRFLAGHVSPVVVAAVALGDALKAAADARAAKA